MARPTSLLLLPSLPTPASAESIREAYGNAISASLLKCSSNAADGSSHELSRLDIAVPTLISQAPKGPQFHHWQKIVAFVYEVVCAEASKQSVDLDTASGVDVRVFTVDISEHEHVNAAGEHFKQGPIVGLRTLAVCNRQYEPIIAVRSEEGGEVLQSFLGLLPLGVDLQIEHVPGGTIAQVANPTGQDKGTRHNAPPADLAHSSVAVGGTFDHIHIGHKLLLFGTALATHTEGNRTITIGITGDELLKNKKFAEVMESWDIRQQRVAEFIESILIFSSSIISPHIETSDEPIPNGKFVRHIFDGLTINYVQIQDPFGPTITDEAITALVISAETRAGGNAVNKKREEKSWKHLDVLEISVLDAREAGLASEEANPDDFKNKISSTEIRKRLSQK